MVQSLGEGGSAHGLLRRRSIHQHWIMTVYLPGISSHIPFSQRCLRRLPSFPFSNASRLLRLSRRMGSRRRNVTDGVCCDWPERPTSFTREVGRVSVAGTSSSRGMANETDAPRKPVRAVAESTIDTGSSRDSEMVKLCNEAAACSVHAEMARVWCGDRFPCGRRSGWMAMLRRS